MVPLVVCNFIYLIRFVNVLRSQKSTRNLMSETHMLPMWIIPI